MRVKVRLWMILDESLPLLETICVSTCGTFYRHEEEGNEEKTTDLKPPKLAGK